jgi:hypothetical protein
MKLKTSTRTRIRRATLAILLSLTLGLPASAVAEKQLPKPSDPTIKVPVSIGGVGLGGTIQNAAKAWGTSKNDCAAAGCFYGNDFGKTGTAEISKDLSGDGKVNGVNIYASSERKGLNKPQFDSALGKFKTKEGIGLGSRIEALKKAYPKAKKHGDKPFIDITVEGKGKSFMSFGFDRFNDRNLITSISLNDGE